MSQTILVTWERVLHEAGQGFVCSGATRTHRSGYRFPNGSEVVLFGFDDVERVKSAEYDLIYVNEGTELTLDDWEVALSRLRNNVLDYQQGIVDCNPGAPNHWCNRRANEGAMTRLVSRHEDNPHYFDSEGNATKEGRDYIEGVLDRLTGARKARLRYGQWVAAEGAVFEETWDAARHHIDAVPAGRVRGHEMGVDWGYRDPGVAQVWGHDGDDGLWLVREIYRRGQTIAWWTAQAKRLVKDFDAHQITADPSRPEYLTQWRKDGLYVRDGDKTRGAIEAGIRRIEERLINNALHIVKGCTGWYDDSKFEETGELGDWRPGRDEALAEDGHPVSTAEEMALYAYKKTDEGKPIKEEPDDRNNHGIDAMRYVVLGRQGARYEMPKGSKTKHYTDPTFLHVAGATLGTDQEY